MTATVGSIQVVLTATTGGFSSALQGAATATGRSTAQMRRDIDGTTATMGGLQRAFNTELGQRWLGGAISQFGDLHSRVQFLQRAIVALTGAFGGLGAAFSINAIIQYADAYKLLQGQLGTVTKSSVELAGMQNVLFDVADRSRAGIRETVTMYARMARASDTLVVSTRDLVDVTEIIQKAFVVGGATTQEAAGAAIQLSQAIASNKLAGDEMRAILENAPLLAKSIANNMQVSIGQLRELGSQGKVTAYEIIKGIQAGGDEIKKQFEQMPITVGQALTILDNAFIKYIGGQDSSLGATKMLANGIRDLAANLDSVMSAAALLGVVLLSGAFGRGISAGIGSLTNFVSSTKAARVEALAFAKVSQESAAAALASAQARAATAGIVVTALTGQKDSGDRSPSLLNNLVAARKEQMAMNDEVAKAQGVLLAATQTTNVAARSASGLGVAFGAVRAAGAGIVGLFGGPWGFALTAATVAFTLIAASNAKANEELQKYIKTYDEYLEKQKGGSGIKASVDPVAIQSSEIRKQIKEAEDAIREYQSQIEQFRASAGPASVEPFNIGLVAPLNDADRIFDKVGTDSRKLLDEIARMRNAGENISPIVAALEKIAKAAAGAELKVESLKGALNDLPNADAFEVLMKAAKVEAQDQTKRKSDLVDYMTTLNQSIQVAQRKAVGDEAGARAIKKYNDQIAEGKYVSYGVILAGEKQQIELEERAKKFEKAKREAENFAERLKRLKEESQGSFLGDIDRSVLEHARAMKATADQLKAYVTAAQTGNFSGVNSKLLDLRDIELIKRAGTETRGIIEKYGEWGQISVQAAEYQAILNKAVDQFNQTGGKAGITAGQASIAYADFLSKFQNYKWINDSATAFSNFAQSAILDFRNIGQAGRTLYLELEKIALRAIALQPLENAIKAGLGSIAGGGLFGGLFGANTKHTGGRVGDPGGATRMVSPAVFVGAPRFHEGLTTDEFATILQRGEHVLTEKMADKTAGVISGLADNGIASGQSGGNTSVAVKIVTPDPQSFNKSRGSIEASLARAVARGRARGL